MTLTLMDAICTLQLQLCEEMVPRETRFSVLNHKRLRAGGARCWG
jgi:hypothetical protein